MTEFKLARKPADYRKCHALMKAVESEFQHCQLSFPTIMAFRENELIGFLSTRPGKKGVVAEPIVLNVDGNASFLYIKLVEAYESLLKAGKVPSYLFFIPERYGEYNRLVEKAGFQPIEEDKAGVWYRRLLI